MLPGAPPERLLAVDAVPALISPTDTQDGAELWLYWSNCPVTDPLGINCVVLAALW